MSRPRKFRKVCRLPDTCHFGPIGSCPAINEQVILSVDEYETIRLIDLEGMTQEECAEKMHIARTTVQAIYASARKKLADLLVNGKRLEITGGDYRLCEGGPRCGRGCRKYADNPADPLSRRADCPRSKAQTAILPLYAVKESTMHMIAVSSEGPNLTDMVDPRFGRAAGFVIANDEKGPFTYIDNGASQIMAQGAGLETAERLSKAGVKVVLSGFVGPKAFQALQAAGIRVCHDVQGMSVGEALEMYRSGKLRFAQASNR